MRKHMAWRTGRQTVQASLAVMLAVLLIGAGIGCGDKGEQDGAGQQQAGRPKPGGSGTDKAAADKAAADRKAKEDAARGTLAHIGHTAVLYMATHGKAPASLTALVDAGDLKASDLVSPLAKDTPRGESHYIWLPVPMACPADLVRLHENPAHYGGQRTVVFLADSTVKEVTKAELDALVQKTKDWLAKQGE